LTPPPGRRTLISFGASVTKERAVSIYSLGLEFHGISLKCSFFENMHFAGSIPIVGAAAVLIGAATIASYVPALRASRVDVIQALRTE
jgi:ABC-type antimicrobial peptide transport system permease subunit